MNELILNLEPGFVNCSSVVVTYDGNNIGRFFKDRYFSKVVLDAAKGINSDNDLYDFACLVYSSVDSAIKHRILGQELMLKSVEARNEDGTLSVKICR
jgi:hypothetical protein